MTLTSVTQYNLRFNQTSDEQAVSNKTNVDV